MTVFFYRVMFGEVPALFPSNSSRSCIRRMKWVHSLWAKSCKVHYSHLEDHSLQLSSETRFRYAYCYVYQVYADIEE